MGWIFKNQHIAGDQVYFYEFNLKKAIWPSARCKCSKVSFSKNHKVLQINIFFCQFANTFLLLQSANFFKAPKMVKKILAHFRVTVTFF